MTAPRELALISCNNELFLSALPINALTGTTEHTFTINSKEDSEITVSYDNQKVLITFDSVTKKISVDRSNAWFPEFVELPQVTPPVELPHFTLQILIDHGSLELFAVEAGIALTTLTTLPATSAFLQKTAKR
jgi:sucrose-6-phosphate hydrolase SacC (GH32 family)